MPSFAYKALTTDGRDTSGQCDAADRVAALRDLSSRGLAVTQIAEATGRRLIAAPVSSSADSRGSAGRFAASAVDASPSGSLRIRLKPRQLAFLTRQLATSLSAGLPLLTALDVMGQELDHAGSKSLLSDLRRTVQQGSSLSEALANHPRVFSPMYVRLVRVGEAGGVLDTVLTQLAEMLERQQAMRERIRSASIYPSIVLILCIISVVVISTQIVPRIIESLGAETYMLPWPTQVVMAVSNFIRAHGLILVLILVVGVVAWRKLVLQGPWRGAWDGFKLKVPVLHRLIRQIEAARFSRSLGTLTQAGVAVAEALIVVRDTVQNQSMRTAMHGVVEAIRAGESIAGPLQRCGLFPPLLVQMVRVGENTGRLDEMLLRSAQIHESEAQVTLDRFVAVLPVAMILVVAGIVGFIVAALILAIMEFQTLGAT